MVRAVGACMPRDVSASGVDVVEPLEASPASVAVATASCCHALWQAINRTVAAGASPQLCTPALVAAADALAAQSSPERDSEAVEQGIREVLSVLQQAGVAVEAARDASGQVCGASGAVAEATASGGHLVASLLETDVPSALVRCLGSLNFEARKDAMRLFIDIQRYALPLGMESSFIAYFQSQPAILQFLLDGCSDLNVFAYCAQMLRGCTRHPQLVRALLHRGAASRLFELARSKNFEISSEAFATLREILLVQSAVSAAVISADLEGFFPHFHVLLEADMDYVVRRQALRLLGEVLLDPAWREAMCAYVAEDRFLQIHMNAMRDSAKAIHLGGFHIFKIFVANPRKPRNVCSILHRNRNRLVKLLVSLSTVCEGDANLTEDLSTVIRVLETLEAPPMKKKMVA
mmetsp:Transcript_13765/g.34545  ORF Transcript_13765/g.34545 Transcript_13765/m.34545 type:complete len:406 (+) Transcript_13765:85-1302(+)